MYFQPLGVCTCSGLRSYALLQNTDDPYSHNNEFGIWALRWSSNGGEILAGTGDDSLYTYDLASNRVCARSGCFGPCGRPKSHRTI